MRQTTTHAFHFDNQVMNVMYFEHDGSLYINDSEENAVQVHGVDIENLFCLFRNVVVTCDVTKDDFKARHKQHQLKEIKSAIEELLIHD